MKQAEFHLLSGLSIVSGSCETALLTNQKEGEPKCRTRQISVLPCTATVDTKEGQDLQYALLCSQWLVMEFLHLVLS